MFVSFLPTNPLDDVTMSGSRGKAARIAAVKRERARQAALDAGLPPPVDTTPPKYAPTSVIAEDDIVYTQPTRFWMDRFGGSRSIKIKDMTLTVQTPRCTRTLLDGALLDLKEGARYGFVGANGSGKTTLLRRIALGAVINWPTHMSAGYISQHLLGSEKTPLQLLLEATPERAHLVELEELLLTQMEDANLSDQRLAELGEQLDQVQCRLTALEGHKVEATAHKILDDLQFSRAQRGEPSALLSGGWRVRMALARAMMFKPDVLMLDEPTNHLDFESIQWLTAQLNSGYFSEQIMIIVSHDRAFLDAVTDRTMILHEQRLHYFPGSYQAWVTRTTELMQRERHLYEALEAKRAHLQQSIKNMKDHDKQHRLGDKSHGGQIASKKKAIDRLGVNKTESGKKWKTGTMGHRRQVEDIPPPPPIRPYRFQRQADSRLGPSDVLMQVENLSFGFGADPKARLFEKVNLAITTSTRMCVLAPNGRGKTTLLSVLVGDLKPSGGAIRVNPHAVIGYYPQFLSDAELDMTPVEFVTTYAPRRGTDRSPVVRVAKALPEQDLVLKTLGRFGLSGALVASPLKDLSGGEVARTKWAAMALLNPDLIVADEASNHLDMQSIQSLEMGLESYQGAIVIISHDLRLLKTIKVDRYVLKMKNLTPFPGTVEEYQLESSALQCRRLRRLQAREEK